MPIQFVKDLSADGCGFGQTPADKISFYGAPPIAQRAGGNQSPLQGAPGSQFITYQFSLSPSAVNPNTTSESTFTGLANILTTDMIVAINKPTQQAGIGLVGFRNSATTAGTIYATFANSSAVTTTPTASETYNVVIVRNGPVITQALTPAPVAANTSAEQIFTIAGSGAAGTAIINAAGQVVGVNITAGGSGYIVPPSLTIAGGAPTGGVNSNLSTSPIIGGSPFSSGLVSGGGDVSGTAVGLDTPAATAAYPYGSGATGIAMVNSSGAVIGVKITNPGSGYQVAPAVSFGGGNWLQPGQFLPVSKPSSQAGLGIGNSRVVADDQIGITFTNYTAATITPTAGEVYSFLPLDDLPPVSPYVTYGATCSTPGASIAAQATAEQAIAITGITNNSDWVVGISKPTQQNWLLMAGARVAVTTANAVYVTYGNVSSTTAVTPTAQEVYIVTIGKQSPPMPSNIYPLYYSGFTSVAANTSAEQTVTVSGVPAGSTVDLNYMGGPLPAGLSIAGVRVSAVNAVAVTWQNNTAAAIVPPAGVYAFGNFPTPGPGVNNWAAVMGSPSIFLNCGLTNELQQTMDVTGLNNGS
jgi:hypothetical protein